MVLAEGPARRHEDLLHLQLENERLQGEIVRLQEQVAHLVALQEVALAVTAELDLARLLDTIVRSSISLVSASAGSLLLVDEGSEHLVFEVVLGGHAEALRGVRLHRGEGIAGWVAAHGRAVVANDVPHDPRHAQEYAQIAGFRPSCIIAAPLQVQGKTIGVLEVLDERERGFTNEDLRWILALASQAASAVEHARIYQNLADERNRILSLQEDTRKRLARDLHDGPAQSLSAITMNIDVVRKLLEQRPEMVFQELDSLKGLALKTSRELRTLLFELRPIMLESQGLVATLESYVARLNIPAGVLIRLRVTGDPGRVDQAIEVAVFAIVQEALSNVKKHARARSCTITLSHRGSCLYVVVGDDGGGFDVQSVLRDYDQRGSFGLLNMRERAEMLGGSLTIRSTAGKGTRVILRVPL